jgi:hypothetical protein
MKVIRLSYPLLNWHSGKVKEALLLWSFCFEIQTPLKPRLGESRSERSLRERGHRY